MLFSLLLINHLSAASFDQQDLQMQQALYNSFQTYKAENHFRKAIQNSLATYQAEKKPYSKVSEKQKVYDALVVWLWSFGA